MSKVNKKVEPAQTSPTPTPENIISQYFHHVNNVDEYFDKNSLVIEEIGFRAATAYLTDWQEKFNIASVSRFLIKELSVKYSVQRISGKRYVNLYFKDPVSHIYSEVDMLSLARYVEVVLSKMNSSKDLKQTTERVIFYMEATLMNASIKQFKPLPRHYIPVKNGFFNSMKNKFYPSNSREAIGLFEQYDLIELPTLDYYPDVDKDCIEYKIWRQFIEDLSDGKADQQLLFMQIIRAVLEGNGRNRYIMMSGTPGSGKSTFSRILELLAGEDNVVYFTMDKFNDHNSLNRISLSTKLITGDDLQKAANLAGEALRLYKSMIDGKPVSLSVKFEHNRLVRTQAVWIQMMNDLPNIFEANKAIIDRTILVNITGRNHRHTKDVEERSIGKLLDEFTGRFNDEDVNYKFLSVIMSDCLNTVEYFEKFTVSEQMQKDTEEMVESANWTKRYVDDLCELGLLNFYQLPYADLYAYLDVWIRENNPSMSKPSLTKFNKELKQYMERHGFKLSDTSITLSKNLNIYNRVLFSKWTKTYPDKLTTSRVARCWVRDKYTKEELDALTQELYEKYDEKVNYNELDPKLVIVAEYLMASKGDANIIDWKVKSNV